MSSSKCCFLTCIQISQEAGQMFCYSHLFKNFPEFIVIHTVKGFGIVNKTQVDVFLELSCFFDDPVDVGNLTSASSAFSKSSLNIWKFTDHVLLKPGLENFEHSFASMGDESNCVVVWAFFGLAFLWDWNENGLFTVLWPLLSYRAPNRVPCAIQQVLISYLLYIVAWFNIFNDNRTIKFSQFFNQILYVDIFLRFFYLTKVFKGIFLLKFPLGDIIGI